MVMAQGSAGGSAQQDLVYNLRITADTEGARLARQAFTQTSKQADRAANEMARSFGPKLTQGWQQVRMRTVEQGKALIGVGHSLDEIDPKFKRAGRELRTMGEMQQKAGLSGDLHSKMLREQAATLGRVGRSIEKTIKAQQLALVVNQQELAAMEQWKPKKQENNVVRAAGIVSLKKEQAALENNIRLRQLYTATLKQGSSELSVFAGQTDKAKETMGSFTGEATMAQKAGQGMILSFSGAQAAAGNYQQALFGLGFSMMFVGKAMLGWPLIIGAAATAMTVGIPKLIEWMKGTDEAAEAQKRFEKTGAAANERLQEITATLTGAKGELAIVGEGLAAIIAEEGSAAATTGASLALLEGISKGLAEENESLSDSYGRLTVQQQDATRGGATFGGKAINIKDALSALESEITANEKATGILDKVMADNKITADEYLGILQRIPGAAEKLKDVTVEITEGFRQQANVLRGEALGALADFDKEVAKTAARKALVAPFELDIEGLRDEYDAMKDAARDAATGSVDAVRDGLRDQTQAVQDALAEQSTAIRDAAKGRQDVIREGLREETNAIRDAAGERTDSIRDGLRDELREISKAADIRVDTIKDAAGREIDIHKDRIAELKKRERELTSELSDLAGLRRDLVGEALTTQAELAALEAAQAQFGGGDRRLQSEIELRRARLRSLALQEAEAQAEEKRLGVQQAAVEARIEGEENAIDAVEDGRDAAVDAAKDAADAAKDAARDTADVRIDAEQRAMREAINSAQTAANAKITEDQRATQNAVTEAQRAAREQTQAYQDAAEGQIAAINRTRDVAIDALADEQAERVKGIEQLRDQATREADRADIIKDEVLPGLREEWLLRDQLLLIQIAATTDEKERVRLQERRNALLRNFRQLTSGITAGFPYDIGPAYQQGGIVPGSSTQAVPIIAHGQEAVLRPDQYELLTGLAMRGAAPAPTPAGPTSVTIYVSAHSDQDMNKVEKLLNRTLGKRAELAVRTRRMSGR